MYRQNARMCSTCARFASTHGSVLNVHTETFLTNTRIGGKGGGVGEGGGGGSLLSLSLVRRSLSLLSFSLLSSFSHVEQTHARVSPVHTEAFLSIHTGGPSLSLSFSRPFFFLSSVVLPSLSLSRSLSLLSVFLALSLFVCPSFSLSSSLLFSSLLSFSLPSLVFFLFSLSNNDNDHSSSRLSLCTHGSNLPECQSACTLAHSLFGEHVRIMQETTVLV